MEAHLCGLIFHPDSVVGSEIDTNLHTPPARYTIGRRSGSELGRRVVASRPLYELPKKL
jgi:hypothetical protein